MKRCRKISGSSEWGNLIYPFQFCAVRGQRIPMKGVAHKKITEIFLSEFDSSVKATMERKKTKSKDLAFMKQETVIVLHIPSHTSAKKRQETCTTLLNMK